MNSRITLRTVATETGLSVSAVSQALRNLQAIPEATRARVRRAANKLGYRPDPVLSALNRYRTGRSVPAGTTLAYVTAFETRAGAAATPFLRRTWQGARARALLLGYRVQTFWLCEPRMTAERFADILEARGIRGLIVAPLPHPGGTLTLPWERFCAVAVGPSLAAPALHHARNNHYQSALLACEQLHAVGAKRIGLTVDPEVDQRHQRQYLAAWTLATASLAPRPLPLLTASPGPTALAQWVRRERLDAVLGTDELLPDALRAGGIRIPEGVRYATLIRGERTDISGIETAPEQIAAAAVDRLHQLLHDNESGIPALPTSLMLPGKWVSGATT